MRSPFFCKLHKACGHLFAQAQRYREEAERAAAAHAVTRRGDGVGTFCSRAKVWGSGYRSWVYEGRFLELRTARFRGSGFQIVWGVIGLGFAV